MKVAELLERIGLLHLLPLFEAERISDEVLLLLGDQDLRDIGVTALGERKKILAALSASGSPRVDTPTAAADMLLGGKTTFASSADPKSAFASATAQPHDMLAGKTSFVSSPPVYDGANRSRSPSGFGPQVPTTSPARGHEIAPGTLLDSRYSVLELLGTGGMGAVFSAFDTATKQTVAIKTIHAEAAANPVVLETLRQEAALGSKLNHPNLLAIRHLELRAQPPYIVMELMDGGDLAEELASHGGKLPAERALEFIRAVLSGLEVLHAARVTHLDVKPQNVLLAKDGRIKLADFGISSRLKDQRGSGIVGGTVEYAPPEQLAGRSCDIRADIYATGIMLLQCLSGALPFERTKEAAQRWHASGHRRFDGLPGKLGEVIGKATQPNPDARYRTAAEFRAALDNALESNLWWKLPDEVVHSVRGRLAPGAIVDGKYNEKLVSAELLDAGVAFPSRFTRGGRVLLETSAIALAASGFAAPNDENEEAARRAAEGDSAQLRSIPQQSSAVDAELAIAAFIGKDQDTARRLTARAVESAQEPREHIIVAACAQRGLCDADVGAAHVDAAVRAQRSSREAWLDVTLLRWGLLGHKLAVKKQLEMAAAEVADEFSDIVSVLCAADVAGLTSLSDQLYERVVKTITERGGHAGWHYIVQGNLRVEQRSAKDFLAQLVRVAGVRPSLLEHCDRLLASAATPSEFMLAAEMFEVAGAPERVSLAKESAQKEIRALLHALQGTGVSRSLNEVSTQIDGPFGLVAFEKEVESELLLHLRATEISATGASFGLVAPSWRRPYDEAELDAFFEQVVKQKDLEKKAGEVEALAVSLGMPKTEWTVPYDQGALRTRAALVRQQQQFHDEIGSATASLLEEGLEPPPRPQSPMTGEEYSNHIEELLRLVSAHRAEVRRRGRRRFLVSTGVVVTVLVAVTAAATQWQAEVTRRKREEALAAADAIGEQAVSGKAEPVAAETAYELACEQFGSRACVERAILAGRAVQGSMAAGDAGGPTEQLERHMAAVAEACTSNSMRDCSALGRARLAVKDYYDPKNALAPLKAACEGGDMRACGTLGRILAEGTVGAQDGAAAAGALSKACDGGDYAACVEAGHILNEGILTSADPEAAAKAYRTACESKVLRFNPTDGTVGARDGCVNLGHLYVQGRGVSQSNADAQALYRKAGNDAAGRAPRIVKVAALGFSIDESRASTVLSRTCEQGNRDDCREYAELIERDGSPDKLTSAVALWKNACDGGDVKACIRAARLLARMAGTSGGVSGDARLAQEQLGLLAKACINGEGSSCPSAATLVLRLAGTENAPAEMVQLSIIRAVLRGCERGSADSCNSLIQFYRRKMIPSPDMMRSVIAFSSACKSGHKESCNPTQTP